MTDSFSSKYIKYWLKIAGVLLFIGTLSSCQESTGTANKAKLDERSGNIAPFLSVLDRFSCKPRNQAFIAAHRGTDKNSKYPENSLEGLQALKAKNILFAEIDIARLKDGTLILAHDGTWERISNGKGPLAATTWQMAQTYLLKNSNGKLTASRPARFKDVLIWAKDKMYLEIDFKSSVDEANVVKTVRMAKMMDQVILISYSKPQAVRLHKLAPKAVISVKISKPGDIKAYEVSGLDLGFMAAWTSNKNLTRQMSERLRSLNIPILSSRDYRAYKNTRSLPDLIVTDYAFNAQQAFDIKGNNLKVRHKCLEGD